MIRFCLGQHHYQGGEYKNKFKLEKMTLYKAGYPKIDSLADEYLKEGKNHKKNNYYSFWEKNILNYNIQKLLKNFFIMVIQLISSSLPNAKI